LKDRQPGIQDKIDRILYNMSISTAAVSMIAVHLVKENIKAGIKKSDDRKREKAHRSRTKRSTMSRAIDLLRRGAAALRRS